MNKKASRAVSGVTIFVFALVFVAGGTARANDTVPNKEPDFKQLPPRTIASVQPSDLTSTEPSLYELGLGVGGTMDQHYPGSDQSRLVALPFPFGIYRGQIIQSDRGGTRARLFSGSNFDFSVSGTGAFPLRSSENIARAGMPDIGWMGQLGPKLRMELKSWADGSLVRAGLSARAAFSANDINSITGRGFVYEAELVYQRPDTFRERLDFFTGVSGIVGSQKYLDYLYGVPAEFATASRKAYEAKAGLLEANIQTGFSYRTLSKKHKFLINAQAGTLDFAANADSPLVKSRLDLTLGFAWVWTFFESKQKAVAVN